MVCMQQLRSWRKSRSACLGLIDEAGDSRVQRPGPLPNGNAQ